jgi:hypothetical protein
LVDERNPPAAHTAPVFPMKRTTLMIALTAFAPVLGAAPVVPEPYVVAAAAPEVVQPVDPSAVKIEGRLGARIDANGDRPNGVRLCGLWLNSIRSFYRKQRRERSSSELLGSVAPQISGTSVGSEPKRDSGGSR